MQMNNIILRNSDIIIFDNKNNFAAAQVSFFSNLLDQKQNFFFLSALQKAVKSSWLLVIMSL